VKNMGFFGRRRIYYTVPQGLLSNETLKEILESCFLVHNKNREEIEYLYNFYKGKQDILNRSNKVVRPEIDERIVENYAKYITILVLRIATLLDITTIPFMDSIFVSILYLLFKLLILSTCHWIFKS